MCVIQCLLFKSVHSKVRVAIIELQDKTLLHPLLSQEFAPSDEELEAYRKGEEWDPKLAEERKRLKVK